MGRREKALVELFKREMEDHGIWNQLDHSTALAYDKYLRILVEAAKTRESEGPDV